MNPVVRSRPGRVLRRCLYGLIAVGLILAGFSVWNGPPYPAADPDAVAGRLKAEAQRVYDEAALPGGADGVGSRVETGSCSYRGLRGFAHIDSGRPDVRSFGLSWSVTDVPEAAARAAQARTRLRLERDGWKLVSENISDLGFRFEHPGTGDKVDVDWYEPTGTFALSTHAPCGKLPDGFSEYDWPTAAWAPR
ncbi:hypothetical protein OG259_35110 [Streptomyces sp. NBC_00250]|uniref:hypothetical protein n=1 Tax=Streptomyces sp. NBC_00250 TaxID=2903641 RepID=UPI002E27FA79|nr:hypothetical protein [Streptomyces sp. NBC_00250]